MSNELAQYYAFWCISIFTVIAAITFYLAIDEQIRNSKLTEQEYCMTFKESYRVPAKCIKYFANNN